MVPSLTAILQRFTGEWAKLLQPDAILAVCREMGSTGWRDHVLTPVTLGGVLHSMRNAAAPRLSIECGPGMGPSDSMSTET